ncbi:flavodoxin family protein [Christensenellaceae bacterium OttesenSCG-928-K19]|nr:flavodoxin family protein [Christensenellaceae bacterium OttesenSCG-928-K19]
MGKRILVLTASPRRGGNSDALAEAFTHGAKEAGHGVFRFDTADMNLHGCRACNKCWSTGNACVQKDSFGELEPYFENCDAIVFASPVYWYAFPAQIKNVIDRFYAYGGKGGLRPMTIKESVLLFCSEGTGDAEYAPILKVYEGIIGFLGWKNSGILTVNGVNAPGDIKKTNALQKANQMGKLL